MGYSTRKVLLIETAPRTVDALWHAIGTRLEPFALGKCRNAFSARALVYDLPRKCASYPQPHHSEAATYTAGMSPWDALPL